MGKRIAKIIGGWVILAVLYFVGYVIYRIQNPYPSLSPKDAFNTIAIALHEQGPFKKGTHLTDLDLQFGGSYYFDSYPGGGDYGDIHCNKLGELMCPVYLNRDVIFFAASQKFTEDNQYLNLTVIPKQTPNHPATILLFKNGRVLSGKDYQQGLQAAGGVPIIKKDPSYLRDWHFIEKN